MLQAPSNLENRLTELLSPEVSKLGYELLDLEFFPTVQAGGALLRLYIESRSGAPISFSDCATVDNGLDSFIESKDFEQVLSKNFTLEVSSPGIDRPLKKLEDFTKFNGKPAIIRTVRPLTLAEMGNEKYFEHHQKQKNFIGTLRGQLGEKIQFEADNETFHIPFALVTKANLDISSHLSAEGPSD